MVFDSRIETILAFPVQENLYRVNFFFLKPTIPSRLVPKRIAMGASGTEVAAELIFRR
jgi:hypothetical protein